MLSRKEFFNDLLFREVRAANESAAAVDRTPAAPLSGAIGFDLPATELKTEDKEGVTYYTLESRVEKCEHSPAAVGTVRILAVGWKGGKIAKFVWGGPKSGKVAY